MLVCLCVNDCESSSSTNGKQGGDHLWGFSITTDVSTADLHLFYFGM